MSFSDDEDQEIALPLGREQGVAGFAAIMRTSMAAAGSLATIFGICPGFMAESRLRARSTGSGQSNPRTSSLGVVVYQFAGHA
jgi:hypothetical protein